MVGSGPVAAFDFSNAANLYTDARTTLVTAPADLIGSATDVSGSGYHANQTGSARPAWNGSRAVFSLADFLATANIDLSACSAITIVACIKKANNADGWVVAEHGVVGSNPGAILYAPPFSGAEGFRVQSRGSVAATATDSPNWPAPQTVVVTGISRVATDTCVLRVNGVIDAASITDQGTGAYRNSPLYIGAGGAGTNLYAGGEISRLIVMGFEPTEAQLNAAEVWCGAVEGVAVGSAKFTFTAIGDSLTHGVAGTVTQNEAYPALINDRMARVVYAVNAGVQGDSTCMMVTRKFHIIRYGTPNILAIYGGTNDVSAASTVQASPTPTSTVFAVGAGKGAAYTAGGWLRVAGEQAQILSVATNTITLTAPLAGGAPAAGAVVEPDTQKNITEMAQYAQASGCSRVLVIGMHYWNFAAAGDTTSVELARNSALRVKQAAAAAAVGAVYVDTYAWMRALIVAGTYTQGDNGWHVAPSDQHLNEAGQAILADVIEATITAQGWT